jgi:lambda family phage portal protein
MSILDLEVAAPLQGYKPRRSKRTLGDPGTYPAGLLSGQSSGGFAAAKINRLTTDFIGQSRSADQDLQGDNRQLRARARKLALDTPFIRKFLASLVQNVVGPAGILMQSKITGLNGKTTAETTRINQRIEEEWNRWCRVGNCTADGRFSWVELQQMAIKNCGREGENLVKFVLGRDFNAAGIALQPIDNDQLDDTMMQADGAGGEIRMGVEVTQYRRPVAYHLWSGHPNDTVSNNRTRLRVPAPEIVHTAVWERPGQTRGYTWIAAAMLAINQFQRYEEAVIVAARASAAKFGVIETEYAEGMFGDDEDEEGSDINSDGTQYMSGDAGEFLDLGVGKQLKFTDPRFPTNTHKDFTQTMLRNIATGLLEQYPSIGNDLEGVNFSSIRAGMLEYRDSMRVIQRWFVDHFCWPIFKRWLEMALLTVLSDITLTPQQREQFAWRARGWDWVDPVKDADAAILRLGNAFSSYSDELGLLGKDFEATMEERAKEQKFIEDLQTRFGLKNPVVLGTDLAGDQGGKGVAAGDESAAATAAGGTKATAKPGGK